MKICLSFDDGRDDQYFNAYQILKSHNLVGTFHITTGFIDGSFNEQCFGKDRKPLTIKQLQEMHNSEMEISSHGDKHITDCKDFLTSIEKLKSWGIDKKKYGFSVPNSEFTEEEINSFRDALKDTLSYVRLGRHPKCYTFVNKIRFVLYHKFHFFHAFNLFNKNNLIIPKNDCLFYSLVIRKSTRSKDLIRFIEKHSSEECILVIMFHSVVDVPTNTWEWGKGEFVALCEYLEARKDTLMVTTLEKNV